MEKNRNQIIYIHYFLLTKGWIIGGNKLYLTNDGGNIWEIQTIDNFHLYSIYFIDENRGWAVGNNIILHSTDSGLNWTVQEGGYSQILYSVHFSNDNIGRAVGQHGVWSTGV